MPVSASATGRIQVAKASAAAFRVASLLSAQSTVAAATGHPAAKPALSYSSVHWPTIASNSPLGVGRSIAARKRATRSAAYRPAQRRASPTSCSLPPGK